MKGFLIFLIIVSVAIFTGTWIFSAFEWVFELLASGNRFMSNIFNIFGWNSGIL